MSARKYFYLVAGLPDLVFDGHEAKHIQWNTLLHDIKQTLHPKDRMFVDELFSIYDFQNLIFLLQNRSDRFINKGNYDYEQLSEGLQDVSKLPTHLSEIIEIFRAQEEENEDEDLKEEFEKYKIPSEDSETKMDLELLVWQRFYEFAGKSENDFIRRWYEFHRMLKNVQSAVMAHKMNVPVKEHLIGNAEEIETFLHSNNGDFGLRKEIPLGEEIFTILDSENIYDREFRFDALRWKYADELSFFNNFDITVILNFLIKIDILERWQHLDKVKGRQLLDQMMKELSKKPETFN